VVLTATLPNANGPPVTLAFGVAAPPPHAPVPAGISTAPMSKQPPEFGLALPKKSVVGWSIAFGTAPMAGEPVPGA